MNAALRDPDALPSGYALDADATKVQLEVMAQLAAGDRIVPTIGGKFYELERSGTRVPTRTVDALCHRQWVVAPEYPLFANDDHAG